MICYNNVNAKANVYFIGLDFLRLVFNVKKQTFYRKNSIILLILLNKNNVAFLQLSTLKGQDFFSFHNIIKK